MATLTTAQAYLYAFEAGFTTNYGSQNKYGSADIIVAIAHAESQLVTTATHRNLDGSLDRGILQINSVYHSEVGDVCAYDPQCAFSAAFQISNQGNDFRPWNTYVNGSYRQYLTTYNNKSTGSTIIPQVKPPPVVNPWPYSGQPWYDFGVTRPHGSDVAAGFEHGIDLGAPMNTPITAVFSGTITDISGFASSNNPLASGYSPSGWGGQVTWKLDNPAPAHGAPYEYVIHLNALNPNLKLGTHIDSGTLLGWSGGEVPGQPAPLAPTGQYTIDSSTWSGGQHTEVGLAEGPMFGSGSGFVNPDPTFMIALAQAAHLPYGTGGGSVTGGNPYSNFISGAGVAPLSYASSTLAQGYTPFTQSDVQNKYGYSQLSHDVHQALVQYPGFYGICLALDEAEHFPGVVNYVKNDDFQVFPNFTVGRGVQDMWSSIIGTVVGNAEPMLIRTSLVAFGFLLLLALMWQLIKPAVDVVPELLAA